MGLRVGSTKDTKAEQFAYGASTLQRRHVRIEGDTVHLDFDSKKSGHSILNREDPELAALLRTQVIGKAGNDELFPGTNDRKMNRWVQETAGEEFTVRDFRTHLATAEAKAMVDDMPEPMTAREHRQMQLKVGDHVSKILGNTRSESLKSYIDPNVFGPVPGDGERDLEAPDGPEIPGETGRKMLKEAFDAGHTEHHELTGGKSSDSVKLVTLSDGTSAVLKLPPADQHRREFLGGVVANALGLDSIHTTDAGEGRLLSTHVPGETGADFIEAELLQLTGKPGPHPNVTAAKLPGGREMGVLDWLTRNRDRNDRNWIVNENGVHPIDHGLTNYGPEDNDRDIPRGVFARHWLGLTQKPTSYAGAGKTVAEARTARNPKAILDPKVSKQYLEDIRPQLEAMRSEMTDEEWNGMQSRFDLLHAAAPDSIPGEEPFKLRAEVDVPSTGKLPAGAPRPHKRLREFGGLTMGDEVSWEGAWTGKKTGKILALEERAPGDVMATVDVGGEKHRVHVSHLTAKPKPKAPEPTRPEGITGPHPPSPTALSPPGPGDKAKFKGKDVEVIRMSSDGEKVRIKLANGKEQWTALANLEGHSHGPGNAPGPKPPTPPPPGKSAPGFRTSLPNRMEVSSAVEKHVALADEALKEAGIDLSKGFTFPAVKIGRHPNGSLGHFQPRSGSIEIMASKSRAAITVLHELGHKIDYEINGPHGSYGSDSDHEFMSVVGLTQAFDGLRNHPKAHTKFGRYVLSPRELFARAFSQYVASKSTDPDMIRHWERDQIEEAAPVGIHPIDAAAEGVWTTQWRDADFIILNDYFDGLMKRLGLTIEDVAA
jgi:hypothetical protein